ncbi:MAG: hypothetical protein V1701_02185 [Planctomycetota bacterium]
MSISQHKKGITIILISVFLFSWCLMSIAAKSNEELYKEKAAALESSYAKGHYQLGLWCLQNKMPEQARTHFIRTLELDPEHKEAQKSLAKLESDYVECDGELIPPAEKAKIRRYAVVSCGSAHGEPNHMKWFWGANQCMYAMLKDVYGYPDEAIFCLHEDGKDKDPNVDGVSNLSNFRKVFAHLAKIMKPKDQLFVYIVGHAGPAGGDFIHDLSDAPLTSSELAKMLDALPSQRITIGLTPCCSGGFIKKLSGKGRVICTSTMPQEGNAADWEGCFRSALSKLTADADNDGRVSLKEAYNSSVSDIIKWYGGNPDALKEHPLLDDNGDGAGHFGREPVVDGDGAVAAKRFLGDEGRKISCDNAVINEIKNLNKDLSLD